MLQISSVETALLFSFVEIDIFTFEFYRRYFLLKHWFPTWGDFAPRGHLAIPGDNFGCHNCRGRGATGTLWLETRDAMNILAMHRNPPTTKVHPAHT